MQVQSSDGVSVALHDLGGDGEPLLVSHATGFCGRAYEPLAAELSSRFHVWALDYRGHGDTPVHDLAHLDWHRVADDLEAVAAHLSAGRPLPVVGHSMGGACALYVESRRPGTFRWVHAYEPIVFPPTFESQSGLAESAARRRPTFPSRAEALARYASRPPLNVLRADALAAYVEHGFRDAPDGSVELKCTPDQESATYRGSGGITYDDLAAVRVPVIVVAGTAPSEWSPAALAESQAAALPHGRVEAHPTLGHFGPLQDPVEVAASVLAFADAD